MSSSEVGRPKIRSHSIRLGGSTIKERGDLVWKK